MKARRATKWMIVGFTGVEAVVLIWFVLRTLGRI